MPLGLEAGTASRPYRFAQMCNLYSITTNQAAIVALFRVMNRYVGNLPPMPGVFPDYPAPVVRNAGSDRELVMMRWGCRLPRARAGRPSPTSAIHHHRIGGHGSNQKAVAWSRPAALPNMRRSQTPRPRRRMSFGSRSIMTAAGFGPNSRVIAAPSQSRSRGRV
jgi:hypothetical protein